jgi:hypothetical protein
LKSTKYLKEVVVSEMTGRALSTLRNERAKGIGIPYIKIGRSVRYDLADVIRYMDAHKIRTEDFIFQEDGDLITDLERSAGAELCVSCPDHPHQREVAKRD